LGNRIFANLVMLGFFTAVTKIVTPEAMKNALPGLVPDRFLNRNIEAFDKGYNHGLKALQQTKKAAANKPAAHKAKTKSKK
jgi:2-oxoglutarate ferredoxin oxidoreductase subunit gamma